MNTQDWQRVKQIFGDVLALTPTERAAYLDRTCSGEEELRSQVERLLASYDSDFLENNIVNSAELLTKTSLTAGQVIGRYRIREQIGTGGMGQVFLADDTELDRPVAFKALHRDVAEDQERVRRFIQEARAASALNHPNILTIHEIGSFEGTRFIVSEYVDGLTLRERMHQGLTVAESVEITCQIAAALQAAHSAGIVHRDIKPENVMLRKDGLVKVLDFGLAKLTEADDRPIDPTAPVASRIHTSPGLVMGTVAYMSPEQARGQAVDARTDLWSLGVVFHEMLTGRSAFEGETVTELITSILKPDSRPANTDSVPPDLRPICQKALAKDKESRYRSAHDLLKDLKGEKKKMEYAIEPMPYVSLPGRADELKTQLIRPRPTLSAEYLFTEIKRHKYATVGTLTAALLVATAFFAYSFKGATPSAKNGPALPAITLSTTEKDLKIARLPTSGKVYDIAISPDGKLVAYVSGETDQKNPIRLRQRDTGNEVELVAAPDSGRLENLSFSPDGKYLYYRRGVRGVSPWEIDRVPVAGGASARVITDSDGGGSVSPDGRYLAFSRDLGDNSKNPRSENAEELLIADPDGSHERVVLHTPYVEGAVTQETSWVECFGTAWSPDSKKIACGKRYKVPGGDGYYKLIAVNVSDGSQEELSDKKWWDIDGAVWLADGNLVIVSNESSADQYVHQLWLVSRGNPPKQITNDLLGYKGLTATKNGDVLAAVQSGAKFDLWLVPQYDASQARQITSSGQVGAGFDWMPDGRIVLSARTSGNVDLWSMNPDGTDRKQLTSDAGSNTWPVSSPDGRYIVFTSNRISRFDDHIFRMNTNGGNVKQLTNGLREWSPRISPDGKWVYYVQVRDKQPFTICKVPIDGGQPVVVATAPEGPGGTDIVDVSRDGRVVFEKGQIVGDHRERTLYLVPQSGGNPIKLLTLPATTGERGKTWWRFTPDGKSFAFNDTRNGLANIWSIPADGKGKEKPLTNFSPGSFAWRFAWSQDGKQFLMARGNVINDGILITNAGR